VLRVVRVISAAVIASALALTATGCGPEDEGRSRTPAPTPTPLFATEEEALAAATDAYDAYMHVFNEVAVGGWKERNRLSEVETGDALKDDLAFAAKYAAHGWRAVGGFRFRSLSVQSWDVRSVAAYVCLDGSGAHLVDKQGRAVATPPHDEISLELRFLPSGSGLTIDRSEVWDGESVC